MRPIFEKLVPALLVLMHCVAEGAVPHTFQPGQIISAQQMNENFAALSTIAPNGGHVTNISVDCSTGPNALTQALSDSPLGQIEVTISGECVEDNLKNKEFTYVTVSGDDSASIVADVIEVNFSSLFFGENVNVTAGTLYVARGVLIGLGRFRSDLKGAAAQAFLDDSPGRNPNQRIGSFGNGYIELQDYGCIGNLNDSGFILSYNHSRIVLNMEESCGSSILYAGTNSKTTVTRAPGVNLSSQTATTIRGTADGGIIYLGSAEYTYADDGSGNFTPTESTGVPPENINIQARNMNIQLENVCLSGTSFLTTVIGHIEPASSCTDTFGPNLFLNNGSHITSKAVLTGANAPITSASSSYEASFWWFAQPNYICDNCAQ